MYSVFACVTNFFERLHVYTIADTIYTYIKYNTNYIKKTLSNLKLIYSTKSLTCESISLMHQLTHFYIKLYIYVLPDKFFRIIIALIS